MAGKRGKAGSSLKRAENADRGLKIKESIVFARNFLIKCCFLGNYLLFFISEKQNATEFHRFKLEILQRQNILVHDCEQGETAREPHSVFTRIQAERAPHRCCFWR
jgi:hypothetical protein